MLYIICYYLKRYWYIFILLLVSVLLGLVIYFNKGTLINYFEEYNNKVSLNPTKFKEEPIEDIVTLLEDLKVNGIYIGSKVWNEDTQEYEEATSEEINDIKNKYEEMYKMEINWHTGSIGYENIQKLMDLISYHINKNGDSNLIRFVSLASNEELEYYEKEYVYYVDDKGVLYLNLKVDEINTSTNVNKSFVYSFKIKHELNGIMSIK